MREVKKNNAGCRDFVGGLSVSLLTAYALHRSGYVMRILPLWLMVTLTKREFHELTRLASTNYFVKGQLFTQGSHVGYLRYIRFYYGVIRYLL